LGIFKVLGRCGQTAPVEGVKSVHIAWSNTSALPV
jgi:hypothetical protein